jgi:ATP-dependent RNA helicase DDX51/DBP6
MCVCDSNQKPLLLFYLVHGRDVKNALVFTKSAESTSRLMRLFQYFEDARAADASKKDSGQGALKAEAFSSDLTPLQRKVVLENFKSRKVDL